MILEGEIWSFDGDERWLSNFVPVTVLDDKGRNYPSVEHAYQAEKSDDIAWKEFCSDPTNSAGHVKKESRKIPPERVVPGFHSARLTIMRRLIRQKFAQHPYRQLLLETGHCTIREGNSWGDTFWGTSLDDGTGSNHLGKMIMEIRDGMRVQPLF